MAWPPRFLFIGGTLAIDFIHTGGLGGRSRFERWQTPDDVADWAEASPDLGFRPTVTEAERKAAWDLREALWEYSRAVVEKRRPPQSAADHIARVAETPDLVPTWLDGKRVWRDGAPFSQVMSSVARDAISLFGTEEVAHFRKCANPSCGLTFVDHSRGGKRQWCTMQRCGNLMKAARHRAKTKGETS
jgi:predicted RNA-binding Zn ribbon-like protein